MRFADLIAPMTEERFLSEHWGSKPAHIEAPDRRPPLDWPRFNALLGIRSHWSEANIKLVMNSRPVLPEHYIEEVETAAGPVRRASPAKLEVFLAMGASLVADVIDEISPEVRAVASAIAERLPGRIGANAYCSFGGIQAFASHCDLHEVFVLQCEGEKDWNIYANRAAAPVAPLEGEDAQAIIDSVKGPVLMRVRLRPGDLLYIPRGYYHDALAEEGASLHVSLSVAPLTGRALFALLERQAVEDRAFREYLPDARADGGAALRARLAELGERLSAMAGGERLAADVERRQRALQEPDIGFSLPGRMSLDYYARSDRKAEIQAGESGLSVVSASERIDLGHDGTAAEWILGRAGFSLQQLYADFRHEDREELRALVGRMEKAGLIFPYTPAS